MSRPVTSLMLALFLPVSAQAWVVMAWPKGPEAQPAHYRYQDIDGRTVESVWPRTPVFEALREAVQATIESDIDALIQTTAARHGLDPALVHAVIRAESAYQPEAVSPKGAIGLMQLMPGTAEELGVDPWDVAQNVEGGVRYLKGLLERFGDLTLALAGYNAGPGVVSRHGNTIPPYPETRAYVERVLDWYAGG